LNATVDGEIGLAVALNVEPIDAHAAGHRFLEDGSLNDLIAPFHLARQPNVDGDDVHRILGGRLPHR
jgi:hypothetical protein